MFEEVDPGTSGSSGKLIDLFRNEAADARGLFAKEAPPYAATLMARELIQNSWDAASELQRNDPEVLSFAIDFDFVEIAGSAKEAFVKSFDVVGLRKRVASVAPQFDPRERLGLAAGDCLTTSGEASPMRVCRIVEHGAVGMYGAWRGASSRMYLAMLSIGYNEKPDGSGGTFGYGKAGLIRASRPRVVLAYSCFRERADDPSVTRRLLGVAYWGQYTLNGQSFNGFARFGFNQEDGKVVPLENEAADAVASSLGLDVRNSSDFTQLGTTFLVLDPGVEPGDLREAIERNWWPALLDGRFVVKVTDYDGQEIHCRPKTNDRLQAFVNAYEHVNAATSPATGRRIPLGLYAPQGEERLDLGTLVLTADPAGWSFPRDTSLEQGADLSLVALMRETRMIVEYHLPGEQIARRVPYVRGVYVASPELNVHLAKTEPKGHERWETRESDEEVPVAAARYASEVLKRIRTAVKEYQDELRPEVDNSKTVRLPRFDEQLKNLTRRNGQVPPLIPKGDRFLEIRIDVQRSLSDGLLHLGGHVDVRLRPDSGLTPSETRLQFALAIDEDGRRGELIPLFVESDGATVSSLKSGAYVTSEVGLEWRRFHIESGAYRADWTARLLVKRIDDQHEDERGEGNL